MDWGLIKRIRWPNIDQSCWVKCKRRDVSQLRRMYWMHRYFKKGIDPFHKWLPITDSFVIIKISLTNLVFELIIQKILLQNEFSEANLNACKKIYSLYYSTPVKQEIEKFFVSIWKVECESNTFDSHERRVQSCATIFDGQRKGTSMISLMTSNWTFKTKIIQGGLVWVALVWK